MSKNKYQLSELKVKSFVTAIDKEDQKTTKGGYYYTKDWRIDFKQTKFTDHKTQYAEKPSFQAMSTNSGQTGD